jgi:hypothetical protein
MKHQRNWSNILIWTVYLALLVVLFPHTVWVFSRFETPAVGWLNIQWGMVTAWAATFAFEAAIAALTHKLAEHIESTPCYPRSCLVTANVLPIPQRPWPEPLIWSP